MPEPRYYEENERAVNEDLEERGNEQATENEKAHSPGNKSLMPGSPTPAEGAAVDPAPYSFMFILVSASGGGSRVENSAHAGR